MNKNEIVDERELKFLTKSLRKRGFEVRRERLSRGRDFRVKSGPCQFHGEKIVFVDKSLPVAQQLAVVVDFVVERRIAFERDELSELSPSHRTLIEGVVVTAAA